MSDNGGALRATAFERTKRREQVVESSLQPDLCAIVRLQQLLLQDNAESKASEPSKRPEPAEKVGKKLLVTVARQARSVCVHRSQTETECKAARSKSLR